MLRLVLAFCLTALAFSAPAAAQQAWYKRDHGRPPEGQRVFVCHAYTCRMVTGVTFSDAEVDQIAGVLKAGAPDAETERAAISVAVQQFELIVGARIGTSGDLPGMQFGQGSADQMDCIDEATNTTSLLLVLQEKGYLRHHRVEEPAGRGFFFDGRYPHATAVLTDLGARKKWAINSWPRANAGAPVIQPLSEWKRSRIGAINS